MKRTAYTALGDTRIHNKKPRIEMEVSFQHVPWELLANEYISSVFTRCTLQKVSKQFRELFNNLKSGIHMQYIRTRYSEGQHYSYTDFAGKVHVMYVLSTWTYPSGGPLLLKRRVFTMPLTIRNELIKRNLRPSAVEFGLGVNAKPNNEMLSDELVAEVFGMERSKNRFVQTMRCFSVGERDYLFLKSCGGTYNAFCVGLLLYFDRMNESVSSHEWINTPHCPHLAHYLCNRQLISEPFNIPDCEAMGKFLILSTPHYVTFLDTIENTCCDIVFGRVSCEDRKLVHPKPYATALVKTLYFANK